ncbi:hypothetical protein, partial [Escherichia coli]|uniref:hypothetical protein n=1 Tax=Escherichia coli TaxID=562 RepID=UPI0039E153DB
APGLGYEYKWAIEGSTAEPEFKAGDQAQKRTVVVPVDGKKTVTLEVKNSFGRVVTRSVEVKNPKPSTAPPSGFEKPTTIGLGNG